MAKHKMGTSVWIRAETRDKLDSIAGSRQWSMAQTIDSLADHWLENPSDTPPPVHVAPVGSKPDGSEACQDAPGATQSLPPCSE